MLCSFDSFLHVLHCIFSDTKVASDPFSNSPRHLFFITPPFIVLHFIRNLNWVSWNQEQAIWTGLNSCATVAAMSCRSVSPRISAAKHHKATYEILWEFNRIYETSLSLSALSFCNGFKNEPKIVAQFEGRRDSVCWGSSQSLPLQNQPLAV